MIVRPAVEAEYERIAAIAKAAWAPIYENYVRIQMEKFGEDLVRRKPEDKAREVLAFCRSHPENVWVTEEEGEVVGFATFSIDRERGCGTILNNAVAPEWAGHGIGTRQLGEVLELFRREGLHYADLVTGLDEAHAPARRMYEKLGFSQVLPSVRYMRLL